MEFLYRYAKFVCNRLNLVVFSPICTLKLHSSYRTHYISHGESLLSILQDNLEPDSLYLLDEPESALSAQRQLTFIIEVMRSVKAGAQFLICSHSPILLAIPGAEILTFDEGLVHPCEYEDTQTYRVTKMFLNQREGILRKLLDTEL